MPTKSSALLEISGLVSGGRGLARQDGLVWFVDGALPGDRVAAEARRRRSRFVEAQLVRIERPSPHRRRAACPVQADCGGCPWMTLQEEEQRVWKRRLVRDSLARIAGIPSPDVEAVRRVSAPLAYRNKVEFSLGTARGRALLGLVHREPRRGLVDVAACAVQHPSANRLLTTVRGFLLDDGAAAARGAGLQELRLVIRRSWTTGELLVLLRETHRSFPRARTLARVIAAAHPEVSGVVRLRSRPGRRGGSLVEPLVGVPWMTERIAGVEFRLPAATFFQVNGAGASALVGLVAECAGNVQGHGVVDLYGGVGAYSFELLRGGASRAVVCDADGEAIACGRDAARRAAERRIEYRHQEVGRFLDHVAGTRGGVELVMANPPRAGMGPKVTRRLLSSRARRLLIVSCNPATLARDLGGLISGGFRIGRILPVDLFPQTAHVETIVTLHR